MHISKSVFVAAALIFLPTVNVYALPSVGDAVILQNGTFGTTSGGEFNVFVNGSTTHNYISFCLEKEETISYGTTYFVSSISDYAEEGGGGAVNGKDQLDDKTAWVYWNYIEGNLSSYGSGDALANIVQETIWHIEEEGTFSNQLLDAVYAMTSWDVEGVVKVMNLVQYQNGGQTIKSFNQSQIIADPVPEPTTMLLFGTGIAGLAAIGRRKMRK